MLDRQTVANHRRRLENRKRKYHKAIKLLFTYCRKRCQGERNPLLKHTITSRYRAPLDFVSPEKPVI